MFGGVGFASSSWGVFVVVVVAVLTLLSHRCDAAWDAVAWWDGALHTVPVLLDAGVDAPVLRNHTEPVERLPTGIRALFSPDGRRLWAALDTCVLRIEPQKTSTTPLFMLIMVVAGDCAEPPYARDGPSGFARFVRLRALVGDRHQTHLFAAVDAGGRLVAGDAWHTETLQPSGALDALVLYQPASDASSSTPQLLATFQTNEDEKGLARYAYRDGRWSAVLPLTSPSRTWPLLFCAERLWVWEPPDASAAPPFLEEADILRLPQTDADEPPPRLLCIDDATPWRIDPLAETLITALLTPSPTACPCALGELASFSSEETPQCATAPPGAYVLPDAPSRLVLCPSGTFNPTPGGFRPEACLPCPIGTVAPLPGAVRCAACPRATPIQGPLARYCVTKCPDWTFHRSNGQQCVPCAEAGRRVWRQTSCVACPPMYAAPLGGPCVPCPEGTASVAGASACSALSDASVCLPTGDSAVRRPTDSTWRVYTTETKVEAGAVALAVAPNGTLWYAVADRLVWQAPTPFAPPPDWALARTTVADALPVVAMVHSRDDDALYLGLADGALYRLVEERVLSPTPFARTLVAGLTDLTRFEAAVWALASGDLYRCTTHERACTHVPFVGGVRLGLLGADALLLLQTDGRLLRWYSARPAFPATDPRRITPDAAFMWRVALATGWSLSMLVHAEEEEDPAMRLMLDGEEAPHFAAPSAAAVGLDDNDVDPMLFVVDAGVLRIVWARGCECAPGYRMLQEVGPVCLPCPAEQPHSAVGARACSVCPPGEFWYDDACQPCPPTLWIRAPGWAEECTLLRSPPNALVTTRRTLAQALRVRTPRLPSALVCVHGTPRLASTAQLDALGAFWQLSYAALAPLAGDRTVARLAAPALDCPGHTRLATFDCVSPVHYWNATRNGCLPCPDATWALDDNATVCVPQYGLPDTCAAGTYLALAQRACLPCPYDTFSPTPGRFPACVPKAVHVCPNATYVYDDGRGLTDNVCRPCETQCAMRVPHDAECDGRTYAQPYLCFAQLAPAGVRLRYTADARAHTSLCPWPPEHAEWTQGPRADRCYYRCLWTAEPVIWYDIIGDNSLCPPPPACPNGTYRDTPTTCAAMATLPANALPATAGGWRCADGWFARHDVCVPCAPYSCALGERFTPEECGGVVSGCTPCRDDWGRGTLLLRDTPGQCAYYCEPPMLRAASPLSEPDAAPCTLCGDTPPFGSACPPGHAWRNCSCAPCATTYLNAMMLLAPSTDATCRVWCRPGFLTLSRDTLWPVADASTPQDPARIMCQACSKQPRWPCPQCPVGTLAPRCTPCVAPTCAAPTYASSAVCPGGPAGPMPCLLCPTLAPLREWVAPPCVSECVRDTYATPEGDCAPCADLPIPPGAPYLLYRSLWNATRGARWWPPAFDPPHLRPRTAEKDDEARAGVCWPCATTTQTPFGGDPCGIAASPSTATVVQTLSTRGRRRLHSASTLTNMAAYTLDRRRIEWTVPPPRPRPRNRAAPPPECAPGWTIEEPRHLRPRCVPCPRWASRVDALTGACLPDAPSKKKRQGGCPMALALPQPFFSDQLCGCIPGTQLDANRSACVRCPRGTVSRSLGNAPCVPLLAATTTTTVPH